MAKELIAIRKFHDLFLQGQSNAETWRFWNNSCHWQENKAIRDCTMSHMLVLTLAIREQSIDLCSWVISTFGNRVVQEKEDKILELLAFRAVEGLTGFCTLVFQTLHIPSSIQHQRHFLRQTVWYSARYGLFSVLMWLHESMQEAWIEEIPSGLVLEYAAGEHLLICKWIVKKVPVDPIQERHYLARALWHAVRHGHVIACAWLHKHFPFAEETIKSGGLYTIFYPKAFRGKRIAPCILYTLAETTQHYPICQWLTETFHLTEQDTTRSILLPSPQASH